MSFLPSAGEELSGWSNLINAGVNLGGFVRSLGHSSSQKATWGDLNKTAKVNDFWSQRAEARALANSQELFRYQQYYGPQLSLKGYRDAGLNPVLAGDYQGSMPTFGASSVSTNVQSVPRNEAKTQAFFQLASGLQALAESQSRIEANRASAKNLFERSETESALRDYKQALTYYKAVNESHAPEKLKAFLKAQAYQNVVNCSRILLMNSQQRVNAKQAEYLESQKDFYNWKKEHGDRIGYNNTYINYNLGDVIKWLSNSSNPLGLLRGIGLRVGEGLGNIAVPEHD